MWLNPGFTLEDIFCSCRDADMFGDELQLVGFGFLHLMGSDCPPLGDWHFRFLRSTEQEAHFGKKASEATYRAADNITRVGYRAKSYIAGFEAVGGLK